MDPFRGITTDPFKDVVDDPTYHASSEVHASLGDTDPFLASTRPEQVPTISEPPSQQGHVPVPAPQPEASQVQDTPLEVSVPEVQPVVPQIIKAPAQLEVKQPPIPQLQLDEPEIQEPPAIESVPEIQLDEEELAEQRKLKKLVTDIIASPKVEAPIKVEVVTTPRIEVRVEQTIQVEERVRFNIVPMVSYIAPKPSSFKDISSVLLETDAVITETLASSMYLPEPLLWASLPFSSYSSPKKTKHTF